MKPPVPVLSVVFLALGAFTGGWALHKYSAEREQARNAAMWAAALAEAGQRARAIEQGLMARMALIGAEHEQEQQAAAAVEDTVLADLRAGTVKLREQWTQCERTRVSGVAAATGERDAAAAERDALAAAVVRVGREADARLAACQAVIRAYSGGDGASASPLIRPFGAPSPGGRREQQE